MIRIITIIIMVLTMIMIQNVNNYTRLWMLNWKVKAAATDIFQGVTSWGDYFIRKNLGWH